MHVPLEIEFDADLKSASYSASWSYLNSTKAQLFGYLVCSEAYSKPSEISEMNVFKKIVNYFSKKLHLRCLTYSSASE